MSVLVSPNTSHHPAAFTAESVGGPDRFSREPGFQRLIDSTAGCGSPRPNATDFVELHCEPVRRGHHRRPGLPRRVLEHVEFRSSQVTLQDSHAHSDDKHHPLRRSAGPGPATTPPDRR